MFWKSHRKNAVCMYSQGGRLLRPPRLFFIFSGPHIYGAMINMGLYYMIYVLLNEELYPMFSWAVNIPLILALVILAAYLGSVPLMLLFTAVAAFGTGPWPDG